MLEIVVVIKMSLGIISLMLRCIAIVNCKCKMYLLFSPYKYHSAECHSQAIHNICV